VKAAIFSDLHVDAGAALGWPDQHYGNSRLRDAEEILLEICQRPVDVLIFGGDIGKSSKLTPTAYRILQRQLGAAKARHLVFVTGNHDYAGASEDTSLHVLANSLPNSHLLDKPQVITVGGLQIGALPWSPPSRLFAKARHNPRKLHDLVSERLLEVARELGSQIDPGLPAVLVVHWLVSSTDLASGSEVVAAAEPVLPIDALENSGPWDVIAAGHNHKRQKAGNRTWVVGSPLRTSFGEQDLETGYLLMDGCVADWVNTHDRPLVTVDLEFPDGENTIAFDDIKDAVVRLRVRLRGERPDFDARSVVQQLYQAGASRVIGPQVTVERVARPRSDLTPELTPTDALSRWLALQGLPDSQKKRAFDVGTKIIAA
jgi:DNA repair exonuclease SbcCD nuclease subunit